MAFTLIYRRKGKGKRPAPAEGDPTNIRVGDSISYWDPVSAFSAGTVEKINTLAGVLRIGALMYGDVILRPPRRLSFSEIIKAERPSNMPVPVDSPTDADVAEINATPTPMLLSDENASEASPTPTETPAEPVPEILPEEGTPAEVAPPKPKPKKRDPKVIAVGTVIERRYGGSMIKVLVKEEGFECRGVTYPNLDKVAESLTGTSTNGRSFFGVKG